MRRAPVRALRARLRVRCAFVRSQHFASLAAVASLSAGIALAGCGGKKESGPQSLGFEFDSTAVDTAKLAEGKPLLTDFEPYRASTGAIRARGKFALPDGARIQVSVRDAGGREVGREQVILQGGGFDTPPFFGPGRRVLPQGTYGFEISTQFNSVWQPENVLHATRSGLALSGPGMRRGRLGEAEYRLTMAKSL